MNNKRHQSLIEIESLVKRCLKKMSEDSIKAGAETKPIYKIEWRKGDEPLMIKDKETTAYKKLVFFITETFKVEKETGVVNLGGKGITKTVNEERNVLLYEGIYPNSIKSLGNPNQIEEEAYKDFIANGIKTLAYYSYQNYLDNTKK